MTDEDEIDGPRATHIAFETERAWITDVMRVLERGTEASLDDATAVLERWWASREARVAAWTTELGAIQRGELVAALAAAPALAARIADAPPVVRAAPLAQLRERAPRYARLVELRSPPVVVEGTAAGIAAAITALDPAAAWIDEPPPPLGITTSPLPEDAADDEHNLEVVDLHRFVESMLRAAAAARAERGLGPAMQATPEAARFAAGGGSPAPPAYPGVEWRMFSMNPDLGFWLSPRIALPRRLDAPGGQLLVTESGGPVTYALHGDAAPAELDPAFAACVADLAPDHALVSFVWLDTDPAGPWSP